jgi:hypothetical protein
MLSRGKLPADSGQIPALNIEIMSMEDLVPRPWITLQGATPAERVQPQHAYPQALSANHVFNDSIRALQTHPTAR